MTAEKYLTTTELEILEELNGDRPARSWGAHVGAALEDLQALGLARKGRITEAGKRLLAERKKVNG